MPRKRSDSVVSTATTDARKAQFKDLYKDLRKPEGKDDVSPLSSLLHLSVFLDVQELEEDLDNLTTDKRLAIVFDLLALFFLEDAEGQVKWAEHVLFLCEM